MCRGHVFELGLSDVHGKREIWPLEQKYKYWLVTNPFPNDAFTLMETVMMREKERPTEREREI